MLFRSVANDVGVVISAPAIFKVLVAPYFISEPEDRVVAVGETIELVAEVGGSPDLNFQWNVFETNRVAAATSNRLTLLKLGLADSGVYSLSVSNEVGSVTGRSVLVTVLEVPAVLSAPSSLTVVEGSAAVFEVTLAGSQLGFQWRKDGAPIAASGTHRTLRIPRVAISDLGTYSLVISNAVGLATSSGIALRVLVSPPIVSFNLGEELVGVSFYSLRGLRYTLEASSTIGSSDWHPSSGSLHRKGTGSLMTLYDLPDDGLFRFYRIIAE